MHSLAPSTPATTLPKESCLVAVITVLAACGVCLHPVVPLHPCTGVAESYCLTGLGDSAGGICQPAINPGNHCSHLATI